MDGDDENLLKDGSAKKLKIDSVRLDLYLFAGESMSLHRKLNEEYFDEALIPSKELFKTITSSS